jgi:cbb3-type cytochrome oxidase subunit 1
MDRFVRGFIRASLLWLGVGVLIGISMAFFPGQALVYRPAHIHASLLGFVSMMIFGVAYHVIPRFSGNPLHSRRLPTVHLWVANVGLACMVGGWILRVWAARPGAMILQAGEAAARHRIDEDELLDALASGNTLQSSSQPPTDDTVDGR